GQYSLHNNTLLQDIVERNGIEIEYTKETKNRVIKISDVAGDFKEFAKNIEKNRIFTGIKELDKKLIITTGMPWGLVGSPSSGKCLGYGTKVRMYDGSLKEVQDVQIGDLLMGDDSTPRKVLSLARGREEMFRIKQSNGMDYVVNKSHILSLRNINTQDVVDVPLRDYLNSEQDHLKGYKVFVEFPDGSVIEGQPGPKLGPGGSLLSDIETESLGEGDYYGF